MEDRHVPAPGPGDDLIEEAGPDDGGQWIARVVEQQELGPPLDLVG